MPPRGPRASTPPRVRFAHTLLLHDWVLAQVGADIWGPRPVPRPDGTLRAPSAEAAKAAMRVNQKLQEAEVRPWVGEMTPYLEALLSERLVVPPGALPTSELKRHDQAVREVTNQLNRRRGRKPIHWKYYQWAGLLFTEIYLDRYFNGLSGLRDDLEAWRTKFNLRLPEGQRLAGFDIEDGADPLARLAFWQATGSGKTLLLHANYIQLMRHIRFGSGEALGQILLVVPNRGLARQHFDELTEAGIPAEIFEKQRAQLGLFAGHHTGLPPVLILDMHRFAKGGDKEGPETVLPERFEGRNLVFVDEGHRGSSKEDGQWRSVRASLSRGGFCIEYSATFAQAAAGDQKMWNHYARSILVDYSYARFHGDGYGKHYRILNLPDDAELKHRAYFTASLLAFFEQRLTFKRNTDLARGRGIQKPLMVFVGASVVGSDKSEKPSDILVVLRFLADFAGHRARFVPLLSDLLSGHTPLLTSGNEAPFADGFRQLDRAEWTGDTLYDAMLAELFNAPSGGKLHLEELKEAEGEMGISLGGSGEERGYFAVVNVGDVAGLRKLCEEEPWAVVEEKAFKGALFADIDKPDSKLTILIGARKFAEGWNSWRVSLMGLLNVGTSEGTQIIQLFGRGVRLQGKDFSLKRTTPEDVFDTADYDKLRVLETLNIFAIRATYLEQFKKFLAEEGLDVGGGDPPHIVRLPIVGDALPKLRVIRFPTADQFRAKQVVTITGREQGGSNGVHVALDCYPRVQVRSSAGAPMMVAQPNYAHNLAGFLFVDHDELYAGLQRLKNERRWTNLSLPRVVQAGGGGERPLTDALLSRRDWFRLEIPEAFERADSLDLRTFWTSTALDLVRQYVDRVYTIAYRTWQTENAEVVWLDELLPDERARLFPPGWPGDASYEVSVGPPHDATQAMLAASVNAFVDELREKVLRQEFDDEKHGFIKSRRIAEHLWRPLLMLNTQSNLRIRSQPVPLNEGEMAFVEGVSDHVSSKPANLDGAAVYLLRNESRRGIGFFDEVGFYPDFLLWVVRGEDQWLTFVDPKGLVMIAGAIDPKVNLYRRLRQIEDRPGSKGTRLDAWILSTSPQLTLNEDRYPGGFEANHVLFLSQEGWAARLFANIISR